MTDMASDIESLFCLIQEEGRDLKEMDPDHELLAFLPAAMQEESVSDEDVIAFYRRFDPEDDKNWVQVRIAYLIGIREALGTNNTEESETMPEENADDKGTPRNDLGEIPF